MRAPIAVWSLALLAAGAGLADAQVRVAVKQRTATTVYLAGGSADGLAVGDRLRVEAAAQPVGEVEVVFLAEHSASCKVVSEARAIRSGDIAVRPKATTPVDQLPAPTVSAPAPPASVAPELRWTAPTSPRPWARVRGGVSIRWSKLKDDTPRAFDFEERGARFDLSVWDVRDAPLELNLRGRSRQYLRAFPTGFENLPADERQDRLYEASLRYRPRTDRVSVEVGRILVSTMGIGYVDGGAVDLRIVRSLRLGAFGGQRADVENVSGFAGGSRYGGYVRLAPGGTLWPGRYDALLFAVRETAAGDVSREYVGIQGRYSARRFSSYQWAEVDVLRGWRQEAAQGKTHELSNLSLSAAYRAHPTTYVRASYDLRRNYRTAETRSVADVLFDKFLHQGLRGSVDMTRPGGLAASGFVGIRMRDQTADTAYSYGGALRHQALLGTSFSGSLDASGFSNATTRGYQAGARLGRMVKSISTDVSWGISTYSFAQAGPASRTNQWFRVTGLALLPRGLWLNLEAQYDHGDDSQGPRGVMEIGYRF